MKRLRALLPNRSTDLDRALVDAVDSRFRVASRIARIVGARHDEVIDPALLPWLLRDWGLGDAAAFLDDWQLLYREGKTWIRERGTDAAQLRAFRWLGLDGVKVDPILPGGNRWALYQIGLTAAPETLDGIPALVGLSRLSKPAKSVLDRIYGGFDVRAIRLDTTTGDGGTLDADSGLALDPAGPILSFGRRAVDEVDTSASRWAGSDRIVQVTFGNAFYVDDLMPDWSAPDDQLQARYRDFDVSIIASDWTNDPVHDGDDIKTYRLIKAGIGFDCQWPVGDVNQVFVGCRFEHRGTPWLADGFRPESDTEWEESFVVEEIIAAALKGAAAYDDASQETIIFVLDRGFGVAVDIAAESAIDATLSVSFKGEVSAYPPQSWVDLRWPEGVAWNDLGAIVGNS